MRAIFALFVRSLRQDTRAKLPPILRTALILILLLIIYSNQREFGRYNDQGLNLLMSVMMLNLGFLAIAAVSIFPAAIAEEKEDETLPLLRMTNLNPVSILLGKFAPQFLSGLMLLAVQIPFTLIARALGGITIEQVLQGYAILGATLFFLCSLALLASVRCRTIVRAGFLTGAIAVIIYFGLPLLLRDVPLIFSGSGFVPGNLAEYVGRGVVEINPLWNMVELLETFRGPGTFHASVIWLNLGAGVVCFLLAWRFFDRYCMQVSEVVTRTAVKKTTGLRTGRSSRAWKMALAWKELHFTIGGWRGFRRRLYAGAVLFVVMWGYTKWINPPYDGYDGYDLHGSSYFFWRDVSTRTVVFAGIFAGLDVLLTAAHLFGNERRGLTLSSLVGLPWTPRRIFGEKVLGSLPVILPWLVVVVVALLCRGEVYRAELVNKLWNLDWQLDSEDVAHLSYVLVQGVCFLFLIVFFTLWIRRGALPAAMVVLGLWNILFFMIMDETHTHSDEYGAVIFGTLLSAGAAVALYFAILRRMLAAATED